MHRPIDRQGMLDELGRNETLGLEPYVAHASDIGPLKNFTTMFCMALVVVAVSEPDTGLDGALKLPPIVKTVCLVPARSGIDDFAIMVA